MKQLKVAFATLPFYGHFCPLVPVASAFRDRGHDVVVAAPQSFNPVIRKYGLEPSPVDIRTETPAQEVWKALPTDVSNPLEWTEIEVLTGRAVSERVHDFLRLIEEWQPDILVRDCAEFSSYVAAEKIGLPHVSVGTSAIVSVLRRSPSFLESVNRLRCEWDVRAELDTASLYRYLHLEFVPKRFHGSRDRLPPTAFYFQHKNLSVPGYREPSWVGDLEARPTLLVSLGTVTTPTQLMLRTYRAVRDMSINVLFEAGKCFDLFARHKHRPGLVVRESIPPCSVLPFCNLFLSHGGFNSVKESLREGVPLIIAPQFGDHSFIARRCEELGLAKVLPEHGRSVARIRETVLGEINSLESKKAALTFRDEMLALPNVGHGVELVEQRVGQGFRRS